MITPVYPICVLYHFSQLFFLWKPTFYPMCECCKICIGNLGWKGSLEMIQAKPLGQNKEMWGRLRLLQRVSGWWSLWCYRRSSRRVTGEKWYSFKLEMKQFREQRWYPGTWPPYKTGELHFWYCSVLECVAFQNLWCSLGHISLLYQGTLSYQEFHL